MKTQLNIGDWSNGMIGVSKTFGGSSILSSPALRNAEKPYKSRVFSVFDFLHPLQVTKKVIARTVMIKSGRFFNDLPLSLYRYYRRFFHLVCFFYIQTSFCHHGTFAAVFILLPDQSFLPSPEFLPQKHWMKIFYPPASLRFLPFLPAVFPVTKPGGC